jgi:MFS family permease
MWVGVATFASMSPFQIAPLGGVLADRFERRMVGTISRAGMAVITTALFVLTLAGWVEVWMVVALALVQGLVRSVQMPADQALVANTVGQKDLANAVALQSTTQHGTRAVGPLLSLPLLGFAGVEGVYALAAGFSIVSILAMLPLHTRSRGGVARLGDVARNLQDGIAYVRSSPPVMAVFVLVFAHCALTMSYDAMLPGFAETTLHSKEHGFFLMSIGVGVGSLVGTLLLAMFGGVSRGPLFLGSALISGFSPLVMAASGSIMSATNAAVLMGISQATFMALSSIIIQEVVPDAVRGRVMSLNVMSAGGIMAVMNLAFGALADSTGAPVLFLVPAVVFLAVVAATLPLGPHYRRIYRTGAAASQAGA